MKMSIRKALAGAGALAVLGAGSLAFAPGASASSGGGCSTVLEFTDFGFENVTACISASGAAVYPDGYVEWDHGPPSSCRIYLQLIDGGGHVVAYRTWACNDSRSHYGPFAWAGPSPSKWRTGMVLDPGDGSTPFTTYSKWETLSY